MKQNQVQEFWGVFHQDGFGIHSYSCIKVVSKNGHLVDLNYVEGACGKLRKLFNTQEDAENYIKAKLSDYYIPKLKGLGIIAAIIVSVLFMVWSIDNNERRIKYGPQNTRDQRN
jgi:hypothetical protein